MNAADELRFVLDTLEDAADKVRAAILQIDSSEALAAPEIPAADEIILYGEQGQILYRAIRLRHLQFSVDWPRGIAGSAVRGLSVMPL